MSETVNTNPTESAGERSATPRTDAAATGFARILIEKGTPDNPKFECTEIIPSDFARTLETDLTAARQRIEGLEADRDAIRLATIEECAKVCEQWGNEKVERLGVNDELLDSAKASAWDALQCATAIRHLKEKS